jgi:hypothetical protein
MTTLTNSLNEQQLFQELDNDVAENYNGGFERFTIANKTCFTIPYFLDGKRYNQRPREIKRWITRGEGIIIFDSDLRPGVISHKIYNLANRGRYAFQDNRLTPNPYDITLVQYRFLPR